MRRPFSLVELLLSLVFLTLLLSTLFGWYRHLTISRLKQGTAAHTILEERYCDQQLSKILSQANLKPCFYASSRDLVFTFDNGAQSTPELSGTVLGRLYFDTPSKTLCLGIWPAIAGKTTPHFTRKLLEDIDGIDFSFYYPPDPFKMGVDPEKVGHATPKEGWQEGWLKEYQALPAMMKLTLRRGKLLIPFVYEFPHSSVHRIVYKGGA